MSVVQSRMVGALEVLIWCQKLGMFPESHWSSVNNGITKMLVLILAKES